jgi:hypothetical protein
MGDKNSSPISATRMSKMRLFFLYISHSNSILDILL